MPKRQRMPREAFGEKVRYFRKVGMLQLADHERVSHRNLAQLIILPSHSTRLFPTGNAGRDASVQASVNRKGGLSGVYD